MDSDAATGAATGSAKGSTQRGAFLLAQVGAYAASRFAQRLVDLGLTPSDVGLLRLIARNPGQSQQELAQTLAVAPSRVVALIDDLQAKGLVTRERSAVDRRNYELRLSPAGTDFMTRMREVGAAHENDMMHGLSAAERKDLVTLLAKVAASHDLAPDVHPGYRANAGHRQ